MTSSLIKPALLLFLSALVATNSFTPVSISHVPSVKSPSTLNLFKTNKAPIKKKLPTFNEQTQKWEKSPDDDGEYPYDAIGSLLRHGPSPFLTRITNASEYEQGILKYMATAGVDRAEATGNIDAKLNNAMDWAYQKRAEKNGAPKVDYTVLKKKQAALVIIWAVFITPLTVNVILKTISQF